MIEIKNLIGGQWCDAVSGQQATRQNPADGSVVSRFADSGVEDAREAIAAAREAFDRSAWAHTPRLRQSVLLAWADHIEARAQDLAQLLTLENGKIMRESLGEIRGAVSEIRYYAGLCRRLAGQALEVDPGAYSMLLREPVGVAGIIVPWNAPAILLVRSLAPALAAGCSAVVKPAPQTPGINEALIRELSRVPNLPKGIVNSVTELGHAVASELVTSADVDVLSFTGSNAMGQRIMAAAAPTMKKLSLELGGKSCCLVFDDVDMAAVAQKIAAAATVISGQQCTAARRVLVQSAVYDQAKQALKEAFARLVVAPGDQEGADMGPLVDAQAHARVSASIDAAMQCADEVVLRGGRPVGLSGQGHFLSPTLVAHGDPAASFVQDEIFGPFVVLERFGDEQEAVAKANDTNYGLSASVWTLDGARQLRVARALRRGTVWLNTHNALFPEAETGGYRGSGLGRLHGYEALQEFTELKHIYQQVGLV